MKKLHTPSFLIGFILTGIIFFYLILFVRFSCSYGFKLRKLDLNRLKLTDVQLTGLQDLAYRFCYQCMRSFNPKLGYLPKEISHPLPLMSYSFNKKAYFNKPQKYLAHPVMIPTPYMQYAPAPGKYGESIHNAQQFRYPEDLVKKKPNEFRIFFTGGSTAWGVLAPDMFHTISGYLEKEFESFKSKGVQIKVINAASGGWTTTDERTWIINRISEYEPDLIITFTGINDLLIHFQEKSNLFTRLHEDARYYKFAISEYDKYSNPNRTIDFLDFDQFEYNAEDFPKKTLKNIELVTSYLAKKNVDFIFIQQPLNRDKAKDYFDKYLEFGSILEKNTKSLGFKFLNYALLFDQSRELFLDTGHYGDIGNYKCAKKIYSDIYSLVESKIAQQKLK